MKNTVKKELIERITITGSMENLKTTLDLLFHDEFRVVSRGPVPAGVGRCDPTRFRIVAERKVKK